MSQYLKNDSIDAPLGGVSDFPLPGKQRPFFVKHLFWSSTIDVHRMIAILSMIIIALGLFYSALGLSFKINTSFSLCYILAGVELLFSGLLNLIAIERGGSKFSKTIALSVNGLNCFLFCTTALTIKRPDIYFGLILTAITAICFFREIKKQAL
jgi:hypothetical protein